MTISAAQQSVATPRIPPLDPPYAPAVAESLAKMMGRRTDIEPLR